MSSATHRLPSSIAVIDLKTVPALANGVRTPATMATRLPGAPNVGMRESSPPRAYYSIDDDPSGRARRAVECVDRAVVRRADHRRRHHRMRHRARGGAARLEHRARREERLRERHVEPIVATRPWRR